MDQQDGSEDAPWRPLWVDNLCGAENEGVVCLLEKGHEDHWHRAPSPNPKYFRHILRPELWLAWSDEPIMVRNVSDEEKKFREENE